MSIRSSLAAFAAVLALLAGALNTAAGVSAQLPPAPKLTFSGLGQTIVDGDSTPSTADGTEFGATQKGTPVSQIFLVRNTTAASLTVTALSVPDGFSISTPLGLSATIGPNGAMLLLVSCTAKDSGGYSGPVSLTYLDPDEQEAGFDINCRVDGVPDIDVSGNTVPITNGDTTPVATDATDFGNTAVNVPVTHVFRVGNRGETDLTLGAVTVPAGFTVLNTLPSTVARGGQADLQVRCDATAENTLTGTVSITNNDPDESPFTFSIRCTIGDGMPEFNPGPGDLPSSTATAVGQPIVITTPPPSNGGTNNPSTGAPDNGSQGGGSQQNGGSQVSATAAPATATPTTLHSVVTPDLVATLAAPTQGIFRPPSTGEAGLDHARRDSVLWYGRLAVIAAAVAGAAAFGLRRVSH